MAKKNRIENFKARCKEKISIFKTMLDNNEFTTRQRHLKFIKPSEASQCRGHLAHEKGMRGKFSYLKLKFLHHFRPAEGEFERFYMLELGQIDDGILLKNSERNNELPISNQFPKATENPSLSPPVPISLESADLLISRQLLGSSLQWVLRSQSLLKLPQFAFWTDGLVLRRLIGARTNPRSSYWKVRHDSKHRRWSLYLRSRCLQRSGHGPATFATVAFALVSIQLFRFLAVIDGSQFPFWFRFLLGSQSLEHRCQRMVGRKEATSTRRTRRDVAKNSGAPDDRWTARIANFCRANTNGTDLALLYVRAFGDGHGRELLLQRPLIIQQSFYGLWIRVYSSCDGHQLRLYLPDGGALSVGFVSSTGLTGLISRTGLGSISSVGLISLTGSALVSSIGLTSSIGLGLISSVSSISCTGSAGLGLIPSLSLISSASSALFSSTGLMSCSGLTSSTGLGLASSAGLISLTGSALVSSIVLMSSSVLVSSTGLVASVTGSALVSSIVLMSSSGLVSSTGLVASVTGSALISSIGLMSSGGPTSSTGLGVVASVTGSALISSIGLMSSGGPTSSTGLGVVASVTGSALISSIGLMSSGGPTSSTGLGVVASVTGSALISSIGLMSSGGPTSSTGLGVVASVTGSALISSIGLMSSGGPTSSIGLDLTSSVVMAVNVLVEISI
ncbi:hypothetical protein WN51_14521 [Melipona quadrifasciata]|uniref:Uncharacterized protein n=1 Tax=Melipona quadrifasciata TaxID=166423 RepID=A0A0M8ZY46_9HYME|nr:hypothetical protein WN51_14521 [Melipona quadrifasciata]